MNGFFDIVSRRMTRLAALAIFAALLCVFCACSSKPKAVLDETPTPSVTDAPSFFSGGETLTNINAKEISLNAATSSGAPGAYEISIKFVHGSRIAGVDEAASPSVPSYRAYSLDAPGRVALEFDSLNYWDYERLLQIEADDPLLYGAFKVAKPGSGKFVLVFQLKQPCTFVASDTADTLKIVLSHDARVQASGNQGSGDLPASATPDSGNPETGNLTSGFHIIANVLSAYRDGTIAESGLTPVLCADLTSVAMISERFATKADAEASLSALMATNLSETLEGRAAIVRLSGDELPEYNSSLDFSEVTSLKPVRIGGVPTTLPTLMPDGIYLCSTADGQRHLLSKPLEDEPGEETLVDIQELWVVDETGRSKRLTDFEFAAIEQAAYSPDGRRLAILERTEDSSFLYIYDVETNELSYNLGEEGFGSMTSNFVWDSMGTAIYAVSGTQQLQLLKYDFTIPDETKRVSRVDETPMGDGDLGFFDGDLYFSDVSAQGDNIIYKIKPEGGIRTEYAKGASFRISPDNKYMALLVAQASGGEESETTDTATLIIKTIATGEEKIIVQNKFVVDFSWGDGGALYYSVGENIGESQDEYPYKLMRRAPGEDPAEAADMLAPDFFPSPNSGVFIPVQANVDGKAIRATYVLELSR